MKDIRVSVRMSKEIHDKLKILVIKKDTNINKILCAYINQLIEEDEKNDK